MKSDDLKREISGIRTWKRSGERVPHKPLLILYVHALGRVAKGEPSGMLYENDKEDLVCFIGST